MSLACQQLLKSLGGQPYRLIDQGLLAKGSALLESMIRVKLSDFRGSFFPLYLLSLTECTLLALEGKQRIWCEIHRASTYIVDIWESRKHGRRLSVARQLSKISSHRPDE